jgi:hypothetical protein
MAKKNTLEEIVAESVVANVLQEARDNGLLVVDGRVVGLYIDTEQIGGLSKKQNTDEDRGRFINAVKSSQITVFGTQELLQDNKLVLVPNEDEIELLLEYPFLLEQNGEDVLFQIVFLNEDGSIEFTNHEITLNDVADCFANEKPLFSTLEESGETEDEDYEPVESHEVEEDESALDETESVDSKEDYPYEDDYEDDESEEDEDVRLSDEDFEEYETEIVSPEAVEETLKKRVYADIDLTVDMSAFEMAYGDYKVPSLELLKERTGDEDSDWLVKQINMEIANANDELVQVRSHNVNRMREAYLGLMNEGYTKILHQADYNNEDGLFKKQLDAIREDEDVKRAEVDGDINDRHREMDAEYEEDRQLEIERLTQAWTQKYDALNKPSLQARKDSYEMNRRLELQGAFEDGRRDLDTQRVSMIYDTARRYELNVADLMKDKFSECLASERDVYEKGLARVCALLDDNRKHDIARVDALRRELEIQNRVENLEKEHAQKLESMKAEMELAKANAEQNLQAKDAHLAQVVSEKDENIARLATELSEAKTLAQTELDELIQKHREELTFKDDLHVQEVGRLTEQANVWKAEADRQYTLNKRGTFTIIAIFAVIAVAVAVIGFLLGMKFQADASIAPKTAQAVSDTVSTVASVVSTSLRI